MPTNRYLKSRGNLPYANRSVYNAPAKLGTLIALTKRDASGVQLFPVFQTGVLTRNVYIDREYEF